MVVKSTERLHALDAVRGGALLLGIFFHAGFSFFPGDTFWLIMDTQRSASLSGLAFVLHMFRMSLFFILAGYFGRMQTERLGTGPFVKDRLKRVGIPLVVFWFIVMTAFVALAIWGLAVSNGGTIPENAPPPPPMTLKTFPLTHLWFLYVLLLLYIAMLIVRKVISILDRRDLLSNFVDKGLALLAKTPLLPLLLAIPTAFALDGMAQWYPFFGIPTPEYGFVPNLPATIAYGTAFSLGWIMHRQKGLLEKAARFWPLYLLAAIGLSAWCLHTIGTTLSYGQFLSGQTKTLYAIAYTASLWSWCFGLIGLALRFLSGQSAWRRYIADSSYWLYLIHLPIVMALQIYVSQWNLAAEIKYVLILGISIPLMLLSYHFLVRFSFIGALLNGRKKQKQSKVKTAKVSS